MSALIDGLLTLARAGSDAPTARVKVQVVECVDAVVAQLSASAERVGVSLAGPADDTADQVDGNPVMLETAIRNLVENAIAATPRGGHVRVSLGPPSGHDVVVVVDDDGPGLGASAEDLFTPFRRGSSDIAPPGAGVGLGLAIARRIAVAHGGRLDPAISPLGGARFMLAVPRADRVTQPYVIRRPGLSRE